MASEYFISVLVLAPRTLTAEAATRLGPGGNYPDTGGEIVDVKVEYPDSFVMQMLEYGERYGRLPVVN